MILTKRILVGLGAAFLGAGAPWAEEAVSASRTALHEASRNLAAATDHDAVAESLYRQLRPRATNTQEELDATEIDRRVRGDVEDKYARVLIANYRQLYQRLQAAGGTFAACDDPEAMEPAADILVALCVEDEGDRVQVGYMTNAHDRGWTRNTVYTFTGHGSGLTLTAIDLLLEPETGAAGNGP